MNRALAQATAIVVLAKIRMIRRLSQQARSKNDLPCVDCGHAMVEHHALDFHCDYCPCRHLRVDEKAYHG